VPRADRNDAERENRAEDLLRKLRHQADASKEERRIVSESLAEQSKIMKAESASARRSADRLDAQTRQRTRPHSEVNRARLVVPAPGTSESLFLPPQLDHCAAIIEH
jgi:hypothetical protein